MSNNIGNKEKQKKNTENNEENNNEESKEQLDEMIKGPWTNEQEIILKRWAEVAKSYAWMHNRSFFIYRWQNFWFSIPVIILSNLTGIANFAQSSIPDGSEYKSMVPLFIGGVNILAGIITTIYQFLKVSELLESHRVAHISYTRFARSVEVQLIQRKSERDMSGSAFLKVKQDEFDRFIEQSPIIPKRVVKAFSQRFENDPLCKDDNEPYKMTCNDKVGEVCFLWFGSCCCCKKTCAICCNKYYSNSPKNSKKRKAQLVINEEDGQKPVTGVCKRTIDCKCNKCREFCRPELNDIREVEICKIVETIDEEGNVKSEVIPLKDQEDIISPEIIKKHPQLPPSTIGKSSVEAGVTPDSILSEVMARSQDDDGDLSDGDSNIRDLLHKLKTGAERAENIRLGISTPTNKDVSANSLVSSQIGNEVDLSDNNLSDNDSSVSDT